MPQRLLNLLRPPELPQSDDPAEMKKYNVRVNRYQFNVAVSVMALLVVSAWAVSPIGFARAQNVRPQIDEALKPVVSRVSTVEETVTKISAAQDLNAKRVARALSNTVASDIRFIQARLCVRTLPNEERAAFHREIENKQDEYRELRGFNYNIPRCEDL